jgi:uncharacterized protein (DUF608 family)
MKTSEQDSTTANSALIQVAMPMGGLGAGCLCLNAYGGVQDFSIRHRPALSALPDDEGVYQAAFALIHIKGAHPITRLLEGPLPPGKIYDQGLQGQGYRHAGYEGMPRLGEATFENKYPFGRVSLYDEHLPVGVVINGWNPFIPLDDVNSGLPCAILEYTLENRSAETVEFDFSYHLSHLAASPQRNKDSRNALIAESASGGGILFSNTAEPHTEEYGSAALFLVGHQPQVKAMWFRGGWFDALSVLWREVSDGKFLPNDGSASAEVTRNYRNGGSISISGVLAPDESITYPVVIAWHFPNSNQCYGQSQSSGCEDASIGRPLATKTPAWRPFYAGQWKDAQAVVTHVADNYRSLRERTQRFADGLWASTLPSYVLDAIASNLAILKSPTILRQENGNLWGWEGCAPQAGSCSGTCTHVWNYAQSLPHLFPSLERTLREQELLRSMDESGHIQFRAALPDGEPSHNYFAAADGQLGGILKLFRDFHINGDLEWLKSLYPFAKRSLDYCINQWDPQRQGGLFEPHHNTYDIEFWGPDGMCGSIYIAALSAFAAMAEVLGKTEEAAPYRDLAKRGAKFMSDELFNGEYYEQRISREEMCRPEFKKQLDSAAVNNAEEFRLLQAEGPKYQYGSGCLSDGVIGAWMAKIYGVETPMQSRQVQSTLRAIYDHNFKSDLSQHACLQRPGYALGSEAGLLLCTWPHGDRPTLPFIYCDEVWTGIEYQVASHLIEEGFVEAGLSLVQAARARYNGVVRNPFNEYECGSYYARAMASYALLGSISGFRYSAVTKTLSFGPKIEREMFSTFFSTASGFGTITLDTHHLTIEMQEGTLEVERVLLTRCGELRSMEWNIRIQAGQNAKLEWGHVPTSVAV